MNMALRTKVGLIAAAWTATALGAVSLTASAQINSPSLVDKAGLTSRLYVGQNANLSYLDAAGNSKHPGKSFSETLRGGNARFGYMLSHGGVIPNSGRISSGSRTLREGVDYFLDAANGTLGFAEPIKQTESIRVSYRYGEGVDDSRSPLGFEGLALNLRGASLNFGYNVPSDKAKGLDFSTYGLALNGSLGKGSAVNGLLYISSPSNNRNNVVDDLSTSRTSQLKKVDPKDAVT